MKNFERTLRFKTKNGSQNSSFNSQTSDNLNDSFTSMRSNTSNKFKEIQLLTEITTQVVSIYVKKF